MRRIRLIIERKEQPPLPKPPVGFIRALQDAPTKDERGS